MAAAKRTVFLHDVFMIWRKRTLITDNKSWSYLYNGQIVSDDNVFITVLPVQIHIYKLCLWEKKHLMVLETIESKQ